MRRKTRQAQPGGTTDNRVTMGIQLLELSGIDNKTTILTTFVET